MMRYCTKCEQNLPEDAFSLGDCKTQCRDCRRAYRQAKRLEQTEQDKEEWRAKEREYRAGRREIERAQNQAAYRKDPDRPKRWSFTQRLKRMGITRVEWDSLMELQRGGCAICGVGCDEIDPVLQIDHSHECCEPGKSCGFCVRGLLCRSCNLAIGQLGDSPELVKAALDYLENPPFRKVYQDDESQT